MVILIGRSVALKSHIYAIHGVVRFRGQRSKLDKIMSVLSLTLGVPRKNHVDTLEVVCEHRGQMSKLINIMFIRE